MSNRNATFLRDLIIWGIIPVSLIIAVPLGILSLRFPGYCDNGDGTWCTGTGFEGYSEHLWGGYMGPGSVVGWGFLVGLVFVGGWISALLVRTSIDIRIGMGITYILVFLVLVAYAIWSPWKPIMEPGMLRGFLPSVMIN